MTNTDTTLAAEAARVRRHDRPDGAGMYYVQPHLWERILTALTKPAVPDVREAGRFTGDQSDLRMRFNEAIHGGPNIEGDSGWIIHTEGHASDMERAIERITALTQSPTCCEAWRELADRAISSVESAVRETNWGQPTFGPNAGEELRAAYTAIRGADQ